MTDRLDAPFLRDPALLRLWDVLPKARVVGGAVRDALADVPVADIDLATPDPPDAMLAALGAAGLRSVPTGIAHGTITTLVDGRPFEVTTLRRDVATDGRHATVAFTDDFAADAARRDFTINAMSLERSGVLHDYFAGTADLAAGRVRFVGDPATRIAEDYLRILRFFRFYARYGRQEPDATTREALREGVLGIPRLSPERVLVELRRILQAAAPGPALCLAADLGVLDAVMPNARLDRLESLKHLNLTSMQRFAALCAEDTDVVADRLRMSNADRELLRAMRGRPPTPDAAGLRRALADAPAEAVVGRIALNGLDPALMPQALAMQPPAFPLHGRDLIAAGATPGPALGLELARLRGAWLDGGCVADAAQLLDLWRGGQLAGRPAD